MKILVITRHTPFPWDDGSGAYLFDLLSYLRAKNHSITVLWLKPHPFIKQKGYWKIPKSIRRVFNLYFDEGLVLFGLAIFVNRYWLPFKARKLNLIKRMLRKGGIKVGKEHSVDNAHSVSAHWMTELTNDELGKIKRRFGKNDWEVVLANYAWMCPCFKLFPKAYKICLEHDVAWRRSLKLKSLGQELAFSREDEIRLLGSADLVVAISESDAGEFREMLEHKRVITCSKSAELKKIGESNGKSILFVGSGNQFNKEGLEWFLVNCWPSLVKEMRGIRLTVCGSINESVIMRPDGVDFVGKVDSLDSFYANADVVIIPLLQGTGLNIKLLEAASYGKAIVASPVVLNGGDKFKNFIMTPQSVEDYCEMILSLLNDTEKRKSLGVGVQDVVRQHYNADTSYSRLNELILNSKGVRC